MKKRFALIGENIGYSLSPIIHKKIYELYNVDASFELISITAEDLPKSRDFLLTLDGFNVTKPHKINIIKLLDEDLSGVQSVNTVVSVGGRLIGYNTDGFGFEKQFKEFTGGEKGLKTLLLGAGGVAQIIALVLKKMGADVYVKNRTPEKAEELAEKYGLKLYDGCAPEAIVNCTSFGLKVGENPAADIDMSQMKYAYDTIYSPKETDFLHAARLSGIKTANGFKMLCNQALKSDEYMCGIKPHENGYDELFNEAVKEFKK